MSEKEPKNKTIALHQNTISDIQSEIPTQSSDPPKIDRKPGQAGQYYRCTCGRDIDLGPAPANCTQCGRPIVYDSPDLSLTVTLGDTNEVKSGSVEPTDANDLIGTELGHFMIVEPLGEGGMGQVFRALDTSLQRYVAVKILGNHGSQSEAENANEHLLQEAIAQARVNHPNVVTIYYVGRHEGRAFLAMELVGHQTLASRIKEGPLEYGLISKIATRIGNALRAAFRMGIVHGDIKPNNILLTEQEQPKVSDFGMSRMLDKDDASKTVGGTPNYLAPELLAGEKPSFQSDMYALGVTLFELTYGTLPIQLTGSSVVHWAEAHETSSIRFPEKIPDDIPTRWNQVLTRLMAKDPRDRYENYEALLEDLLKVQPTQSVPARAFPRVIAWFFDAIAIGILTIPVASIIIPAITRIVGRSSLLELALVAGVSLLPITVFLACFTAWRQSIGRHLMGIRVVSRFGLQPPRTWLALREVFRLMPFWLGTVVGSIIGTNSSSEKVVFAAILAILASGVFGFFRSDRRSLHDLIFKTKVNVDTEPRKT